MIGGPTQQVLEIHDNGGIADRILRARLASLVGVLVLMTGGGRRGLCGMVWSKRLRSGSFSSGVNELLGQLRDRPGDIAEAAAATWRR